PGRYGGVWQGPCSWRIGSGSVSMPDSMTRRSPVRNGARVLRGVYSSAWCGEGSRDRRSRNRVYLRGTSCRAVVPARAGTPCSWKDRGARNTLPRGGCWTESRGGPSPPRRSASASPCPGSPHSVARLLPEGNERFLLTETALPGTTLAATDARVSPCGDPP